MSTSERVLAAEQSAPSPTLRGGTWPLVGLVASTLLILIEVLRTLYPLGYSLVGDLGFMVTPAVLLVVFLSPMLVVLARSASGRTKLTVGVVALSAARMLLQLLTPPPLWGAAVAAVVALTAFTVVLGTTLGRSGGAVAVALGFVVAAGADAALKSAYAAWDRVWQHGAGPLLVTLAVCAAPVVFLMQTARDGMPAEGEPRRGRMGRVFSVAVLLMPTMMMLASVAFVGSASGLSLPAAAFATIGSAALAVVATGMAAAAHISRLGGLAAAAALAIVALAMTSMTGLVVVLLAALGQCLVGVLLVGVLLDEPTDRVRPSLVGTAVGSTLGFVLMFVLTLLYPFHYEMPLPISNTLLPALAVVMAALGLLARCDASPKDDAVSGVGVRTTVLAPAAGLGLVAVGVAVGLAATAHDPVTVTEARLPLTVASFNMDQAATAEGAVDFSAAADQIEALDADVVALQEVARGWPLSGMNDFAAWLEHSRGTVQHFAPAADEQFGNLLVTRVALASVHTLELPQGDGSMGRSAIVATIPSPDGPVTVIAVHLQHRNSAGSIEARQQELQVILAEWAGAPRTIIVGDFNANNQPAPDGGAKVLVGPDQENTLQPLLDAGFTTTQPTERCTMPTSNDNCSDYIFVTPDLVQDPPVEVLPQGDVGDHHPIVGIQSLYEASGG